METIRLRLQYTQNFLQGLELKLIQGTQVTVEDLQEAWSQLQDTITDNLKPEEAKEVVTGYLFEDEQKDFLNWLDDMGYDDEQIDKFEQLTTEQKIMFMEIEKLTVHVFYNILVQANNKTVQCTTSI
jgi:23S rRNA maturation-related 3'-5' exoribonuclease YhaM